MTTNSPDGFSENAAIGATNNAAEVLTDLVRFVRFRYWNGAVWVAGWTNNTPPPGVEIVLASEALADDAAADTFPPESFRRVVFLPAGLAPRGASNEITEASPLSETLK
jgi:hypothetical protein